MFIGCKHTFKVSWGLGQGVRGLGVRGALGHGTMNIGWNIMMCGCKHTFRVSCRLGQGVRGLGVRGLGARDHEHRVEHHDVWVQAHL